MGIDYKLMQMQARNYLDYQQVRIGIDHRMWGLLCGMLIYRGAGKNILAKIQKLIGEEPQTERAKAVQIELAALMEKWSDKVEAELLKDAKKVKLWERKQKANWTKAITLLGMGEWTHSEKHWERLSGILILDKQTGDSLNELRGIRIKTNENEKWALEQAARIFKSHPVWDWCNRVKGLGPVAALTFVGYKGEWC